MTSNSWASHRNLIGSSFNRKRARCRTVAHFTLRDCMSYHCAIGGEEGTRLLWLEKWWLDPFPQGPAFARLLDLSLYYLCIFFSSKSGIGKVNGIICVETAGAQLSTTSFSRVSNDSTRRSTFYTWKEMMTHISMQILQDFLLLEHRSVRQATTGTVIKIGLQSTPALHSNGVAKNLFRFHLP